MLRELIAARIARGKVDCRLSRGERRRAGARGSMQARCSSCARLPAEAAQAFPDAAPLRIADVLRWPGVLAEPAPTRSARARCWRTLCRRALDELCAARAREGAKLAAILRERVAEMRRRLAEVAPLVPEAIAAYRARLAERLREVLGSGRRGAHPRRDRAVRRQDRRRRGAHAPARAPGRGRARAGQGRRGRASGWISSRRNSTARPIPLHPRPPGSRSRIARSS